MIYVCSLNPSLDYHMSVSDFVIGATNRSSKEQVVIGGKGINVSIVLNQLQETSTLVGFIGGFTGNEIRRALTAYPLIRDRMVVTKNPTRINVKVGGDRETEINGKGPVVSAEEIELMEKSLRHVMPGDTVILTGSVANGMDYDWYIQLAKSLHQQNIEFVVDISNKSLIEMALYKPFLVKPNVDELRVMMGDSIESEEEIIRAGKRLIDLGVQHCIVSNGSKGSYLITENEVLTSNIPMGTFKNSVGSGDSMVAGFVASMKNKATLEEAYAMAVACASATAYSDHLGELDSINQLLRDTRITKIRGEN